MNYGVYQIDGISAEKIFQMIEKLSQLRCLPGGYILRSKKNHNEIFSCNW